MPIDYSEYIKDQWKANPGMADSLALVANWGLDSAINFGGGPQGRALFHNLSPRELAGAANPAAQEARVREYILGEVAKFSAGYKAWSATSEIPPMYSLHMIDPATTGGEQTGPESAPPGGPPTPEPVYVGPIGLEGRLQRLEAQITGLPGFVSNVVETWYTGSTPAPTGEANIQKYEEMFRFGLKAEPTRNMIGDNLWDYRKEVEEARPQSIRFGLGFGK